MRFPPFRILIGLTAFIALAAAPALAQQYPDPPDNLYEFESFKNGAWHDPATWGTTSTIPSTGDDVRIKEDHLVTIQRQEAARHRLIHVEGELRLWIHSSTRLYTESLYISENGPGTADDATFLIGDVNNPVKVGKIAEVVFTSSGAIDTTWDPEQLSRGLVSDGTIRLFGQSKTPFVSYGSDLEEGDDFFLLEPPHGNWQAGDDVVIAGTYFQRVRAPQIASSQDERRTVKAITGDRFELKGALLHDHLRVDGHPFHIANLTRNLILRSETTTSAEDRGHVMFRNSDVHIENVVFRNLGRTDKRIPLDDFDVQIVGGGTDYDIVEPLPANIDNRRGRYAVHFHQNGIQPAASSPPSKVYGSVVDGTIGWGFVNHSSHVDFQDNVAYSFSGAGFVTESGDELGNFFDNIAIRGTGIETGNGGYRPVRIVFKNAQRPQPLSDFAFSGDGFWFQGPAVRVRNNVATGCDGAGMIWFTTGAPDMAQLFLEGGNQHNRYTHFPRSALTDVYGVGHGLTPRYWDHSVTDEKLVISDLPILELDGFTGYANLVGFRLRFNNQSNVDWYKEDPFDYDEHIEIVCGGSVTCAVRDRQAIDDLTLWNNEQAFRMRYTTKNDWTNVEADNRLAYADSKLVPDPFIGHAGAEINFQILDNDFDNLSIDGYPVAGWIQKDAADNVRPQIAFTNPNPPAYSNYANFDTWIKEKPNPPQDPLFVSCNAPGAPVATSVSSSSATVSWTAGTNNTQYLVRYQPDGDQQWSFVRTTGTSAVLSGLPSGTDHDVQVVGGCSVAGDERNLSPWSATGSFTTNP